MPFKQDPEHGGTEKDGTRSKEYCSYCYHKGAFVDTMKMEEMVTFVIEKMKEMKVSSYVIEATKKQIPTLKRWSQV